MGGVVKVADVVFREQLYPRIEKSANTVQKYAEDLSVLPPIEINQNKELIDGWHRWTAHKKCEAETIPAIITQTASDAELLEFAIERNAKHGLQLSQEDKRNMARTIYNATPEKERDTKKAQLAALLSVGDRTVRDWLSRIDKDAKEARDKRIFDMWLSCHTQEEIAEAVSVNATDKVLRVSGNLADLPKNQKAAAEHATDFDPPIYNVWKQQTKTSGSNHFGNSEVRWVDNLLYLYTNPFDVVVDPFGGGGSTIDICKKRFRRYFVSDRRVAVEHEGRIREHDITSGLPRLPWQNVRLVYLDPPYWKQAEGQYSNDATDLANMNLDDFNGALSSVIKGFKQKLKGTGARIVLLIQPTQWRAPERQFTDHIGDMLRAINLPVEMRISCPYESQQCTAQMVDWAKENKQLLVLSREMIVWRVD